MQALQRITTEYDEHEDRLRLSGELSDGSSVLLWLTQRLLYRILPHLTQWLGQHDAGAAGNAVGLWQDSDWIQSFAQQAAQEQLAPSPPVRTSASTASWRVDRAHIIETTTTTGTPTLCVVFQGPAQQEARLVLAPEPLRQWLGIVYAQTQRGQWPMAAWPTWMHESQACGAPPAAALH